MSAEFFREMQEMAQDMMAEYGVIGKLIKSGVGDGKPYRPGAGKDVPYDIICLRVTKNIRSQSDPRLSVSKTKYLVSSTIGVEILPGDKIQFGSKEDVVTVPIEIAPSGLTLLWVVETGNLNAGGAAAVVP